MRLALVFGFLALAACATSPRDQTPVYVVQPGDTLYTIAWRYGVDYRTLASWNGLENPDLILVGQLIRLSASPGAEPEPRVAAPAPQPAPRAPTAPGPRVAAPVPQPAQRAPAPPGPVLPSPRWQWPTQGPVISEFGSTQAIASGIGIGGRPRQPVNAAAGGRVVYAGSGLIRYGQLVIIKHNDTFLSAYGYNDRLVVDQGDDVRQGQKIAEMGLGPERTARLHFEIRRNGVPVNPAQYLSARQ
ncbi:peptidoglycan DD-metalloendopeptidase family protein [Candidatus Rariloculus sp.]|uniref:peptidoglycan DD-metalloendopeptidase family protein n=1 Tax=Candidatus Rariloculus sp. TaxID=3101265 RepID=UPI003D0CED0E